MRKYKSKTHMRIDSKKTAARIIAAIKASKKSQEEIGAHLGIDQSRISRYCRGDFVFYRGGIKKLCDYLNAEPVELEATFNSGKHPALFSALTAALAGNPRNERAVTALLRAVAQLKA